MLLEAFGTYSIKENLTNENQVLEELTPCQQVLVFAVLFVYIYITIYTALKYPIGGNVVLSVVLAILFSSLFWFIKLLEVLFIGSKSFVKSSKKRRAKKRKGKK
jgi:hypothetical protein